MNPVVAVLAAGTPVAVGALVLREQKRIGWLLVVDGVSFWLVLEGWDPTGRPHPLVDQLAAGSWVFLFVWVAQIAYLLPDGCVGSPRWRRWLQVTTPGVGLLLIGSVGDVQGFRAAHHGADPPLRWLPAPVSGLVGTLGLLLSALFILGAVLAVRWRLAHAEGEDRVRLLWLVWGALSVPVGLVGAWASHFLLSDDSVATDLFLSLAAVGIPVSIGIAVLRHQLFDIQVVLAKTLVYALLTVVLGGVYVVLLWTADRLLGDRAIGGAAAVVVVAVVAAPLYATARSRIERWVYGYRTDPAEAVRRLASSVDAAHPLGLVGTITASVADALKVSTVWIEDPDVPGEPDGRCVRVPLVHGGGHVGDLVVQVPRGRTMSPADRALLDVLARQAAVTVRAAQLATELQASRARIVTAREEERKRIRRDLHDGLGPVLAAIVLRLDAARSRHDGQERDAILDEVGRDARATIAEVRHLVDDLRPPAIDEVGLVGAIRQRAGALSTGSTHFSVAGPEDSRPLPAAVEVAAFRIASEAMANAAKHSGANRCVVDIRIGTLLELTVTDDGVGSARQSPHGVGWASMTERAAELGGSCTISTNPDGGAMVHAALPLSHDSTSEVTA